MLQIRPTNILKEEVYKFDFSICTLVTDIVEYNEMLDSFFVAGFTEEVCEFLYIDNSEQNTFDAYAGINRFLRKAQGKYIIICHQDIFLKDDKINDLLQRIVEINNIDPKWAVLSNAGGINLKYTAMHLIQGSGNILHEEHLPLKTANVDENFILIKSDANLALSVNLEGFHFYGTDICLIADILGYSAYIIDFKIIHKSDGKADDLFYQLKRTLIKKYSSALRSRFVGTTFTRFYISGNKILSFLGNTGFVLFWARQYYKYFKPQKGYSKKHYK